MNTWTDGEWMRVEDALAVLGMSDADAIDAICKRAYNGLIRQKRSNLFSTQDGALTT